jgi:hypothetical protein
MCAAARDPDDVSPSDAGSDGEPPVAPTSVAPVELARITPKRIAVTVSPTPPASPVRLFGARMWLMCGALIAGAVGGYVVGHGQRITVPDRSPSAAETEHANPPTQPASAGEATPARLLLPRLMVEAERVLQADEPAPLTIAYEDAGSEVSVMIDGLAPGSTLEAGTPVARNAWRLANADLHRAVIRPPRGFVGVMTLIFELRLADDTVGDRQSLQLEWSGASAPAPAVPVGPPPRHRDASEITALMKRGKDLMASGDIVAARLMFQPAAEAGDASAAFALAETYDPSVLDKLATTGIQPDVALARQWYEKAKELGSTAAPERLVGLTR